MGLVASLMLLGCPPPSTPAGGTTEPAGGTAHPPVTAPPPTTQGTPAAGSAAAAASPPASADVMSGASVVSEGPGEKVLTQGQVDGAALRRHNVGRLKQTRWPVVVVKGGTAEQLGRRICEQVVPRRPATTPVLIKPNICGFHALKKRSRPDADDGMRGRITDPAFVRGVVTCLKARGHTQITIAEGCAVGHEMWARAMEVSGYRALSQELGVPLVAMDDDGVFDVRGGKPGKPLRVTGMAQSHVPTFVMPKILAEHLQGGLFLSVPKIKAHRYAVVSVGIKGTQGVVMRSDRAPAHQQKWRMHAELHRYLANKKRGQEDRAAFVKSLELFSDRVLDVLEVTLPDAILAEGAPAMSGDGFDVLLPSTARYAVGGTNPVLVDKVAADLMGLWDNAALAAELGGYRTSPLITIAAKRYGIDLKDTKVVGDGAALLRQPRPARFRSMAGFSIGIDAPSSP